MTKILLFSISFAILSLASVAHAEIMRGHYVYGNEVETFQPCDAKKVYWVRGTDGDLASLRKSYQNLENKSEPYQSIFVRVDAVLKGKAKEGFAADYDGQVFIQKVLEARAKAGSDCLK